jgi:CheY-like chemotaxis protein/anti-sigma regulatory factor (Ser/Thr protein kinase)
MALLNHPSGGVVGNIGTGVDRRPGVIKFQPATAMTGNRILVVDDDPDIYILLKSILEKAGYTVEGVSGGGEALACLESSQFDLILTDVNMPGLNGIELLQKIHERRLSTPVVVMTAQNTPENVVRSIRDRAFTYFSKPFSASAVLDIVANALETKTGPDDIEVLSARPNWIALRLRCKLATAERLLHFIRELPVGLTSPEQEDIAIGFRELLMNAIEHGGRSDPEQRVEIAYIRTKRAILYWVRDPGPGFSFDDLAHAATTDDPLRHIEVRTEAGMRPGGFGILLTREIADELLYNEKGNEVLLVKYLGKGQ